MVLSRLILFKTVLFLFFISMVFFLTSCENIDQNDSTECITALDCGDGFLCVEGKCIPDIVEADDEEEVILPDNGEKENEDENNSDHSQPKDSDLSDDFDQSDELDQSDDSDDFDQSDTSEMSDNLDLDILDEDADSVDSDEDTNDDDTPLPVCGDTVVDNPDELCDGNSIVCSEIGGAGFVNEDEALCNSSCDGWVVDICVCGSGFEKNGEQVCVDINECTAPSHDCDINATCVNTEGSFVCECNENFTGTGKECTADTRTGQSCTGLPAHASWNTASSIDQIWSGGSWMPSTTASYNPEGSTTECRFKCVDEYHWDGFSCISNSRVFNCSSKPATGTVWNTVSSYTQSWNGSIWMPANSSTTYNITGSTTECRYQCSNDFYWSGSACVECTTNTHCSDEPGRPYCNTGNNTCAECLNDTHCSSGYVCSANICVMGCDSVTASFNGSWTDSKGKNWTSSCSGSGCINWILSHSTYANRAAHQPDGNAETSTSYLVSPLYTRKSGCSLSIAYDYRFQENSTTSDWMKLEVCTGSCSSWTTVKQWSSSTSSIYGETADISAYVPNGSNFKVRWAHYSPKVTYHYPVWVDNFIINGI